MEQFMRPRLRTINYSKSVFGEAMDNLFDLSFKINENAKDREAKLAAERRAEFRDEKNRNFTLELEKERNAQSLLLDKARKEYDLERDIKMAELKSKETAAGIRYNVSLGKVKDSREDMMRLEDSLLKFGASKEQLHMTSNLENLSYDIFESTGRQAGVNMANAQVYENESAIIKSKLLELENQGRILKERELEFAGENKILQGPEFKDFMGMAQTAEGDTYVSTITGKEMKGLGWNQSYGAKFTFAEHDPADRERAALEATTRLLMPSQAIIATQGQIIMSQFTLEEPGDFDDLVEYIEKNKSSSKKDYEFSPNQKKELGLLVKVMAGIENPVQMYDKIMEYSGNEEGDYNLDRLLGETSPVAWENFKFNYAEYSRIKDDKLESVFMGDPQASFKTAIKSMKAFPEMLQTFHDMNQGVSPEMRIANFIELEKTFAKNNNLSPTEIANLDLGPEYDKWLEAEGKTKFGHEAEIESNLGDTQEHISAKSTVEMTDKARKKALFDTREKSMVSYLRMKDEMDEVGEDALTNRLQEHNYGAHNTKVFNDQMLENPDNLKYIKEEALASIDRFLEGGWSSQEGFHKADDAQELLDLLIRFQTATTGMTQEEAEAEHKEALKALAKFK